MGDITQIFLSLTLVTNCSKVFEGPVVNLINTTITQHCSKFLSKWPNTKRETLSKKPQVSYIVPGMDLVPFEESQGISNARTTPFSTSSVIFNYLP